MTRAERGGHGCAEAGAVGIQPIRTREDPNTIMPVRVICRTIVVSMKTSNYSGGKLTIVEHLAIQA